MRKPSSSRPTGAGRRGRSQSADAKAKAGGRPVDAKTAPAKRLASKSASRQGTDKPLVYKFQIERPKPAAKPVIEETKPVDPVLLGVQNLTVLPDEAGMRVDRFLEARFPSLSFSHIQRIARKGELRVNSKRVETKDRLEAGQTVRVPPLSIDARPIKRDGLSEKDRETRDFLASITIYEDDDMLVLNKPMGLAVQGGSGMVRHVDGLLEVLTDKQGQKPRLVHRLDRDTSGCLVIAKNRFSASALAKSFRARDTRKIYWALVAGVPRVKQGRVSTFLAKGEDDEGDAKMMVARHGDEGASHAVTYYAVVETAGQKVSWLSMKPVTGRTHQLRAHAAHIGHPIVGDPKYFNVENWELPGGIQKKLHLLARRIVIPHPRTGKPVDVTAPLPPHMKQSWNLLGFDTSRYDPIEEAPE
jgi:23S rRNA pseudouridine955/2504/2580 synthase